MEVGISFNDIKSYTDNMSKGLDDKLFFLNRINFKADRSYVFVDFGCADGVLISALYGILKERGVRACYIGYDISDEMINLAKAKCDVDKYTTMFTTDWSDVEEKIKKFDESVLILSSVVHEVYSYANVDNDDIGVFWHRVRSTGFDYICVRDMMCSQDINRPKKDFSSIFKYSIKMSFLNEELKDFENKWGSIENNKNFVHFLLKYRWQINWEREVNENYFPLYIDEFMERFNEKYNVSYFERFRVPYLDKCIKEDFGIELDDYTHIKAVFEIKKVKEG